MKTKFAILLAICLIGGQLAANGQENVQTTQKPTFEQMAQMKAERMASALTLDDKTADKFIKTYKEYLTECRDLRKCRVESNNQKPEGRKAYKSDKEVEEQILARFDQRQKKLNIDKKYYDEFSKFLGPKQIQRLYSLCNGHKGHNRQQHCVAPGKGAGKKAGQGPYSQNCNRPCPRR